MRQYSLMIVDDEELARRHILQDISWETLGVGRCMKRRTEKLLWRRFRSCARIS